MDEPYFVEVELLPKLFLGHCKNHPNEPQNNTTEINKNIKNRIRKKIVCVGGYYSKKIMFQKGKTRKT